MEFGILLSRLLIISQSNALTWMWSFCCGANIALCNVFDLFEGNLKPWIEGNSPWIRKIAINKRAFVCCKVQLMRSAIGVAQASYLKYSLHDFGSLSLGGWGRFTFSHYNCLFAIDCRCLSVLILVSGLRVLIANTGWFAQKVDSFTMETWLN